MRALLLLVCVSLFPVNLGALGYPVIRKCVSPILKPHGHRERVGIIAQYACGSPVQLGGDKEGVCVIRIILKRTGKSTRLSVW